MTDRHGAAVHERLSLLVNEVVGQPADTVIPADRQLSELGLSSIKMVNLMLAVEAAFDLTIPQADITPENFHCLAAVAALVARLSADLGSG
jgi:acyl carrier protein